MLALLQPLRRWRIGAPSGIPSVLDGILRAIGTIHLPGDIPIALENMKMLPDFIFWPLLTLFCLFLIARILTSDDPEETKLSKKDRVLAMMAHIHKTESRKFQRQPQMRPRKRLGFISKDCAIWGLRRSQAETDRTNGAATSPELRSISKRTA